MGARSERRERGCPSGSTITWKSSQTAARADLGPRPAPSGRRDRTMGNVRSPTRAAPRESAATPPTSATTGSPASNAAAIVAHPSGSTPSSRSGRRTTRRSPRQARRRNSSRRCRRPAPARRPRVRSSLGQRSLRAGRTGASATPRSPPAAPRPRPAPRPSTIVTWALYPRTRATFVSGDVEDEHPAGTPTSRLRSHGRAEVPTGRGDHADGGTSLEEELVERSSRLEGTGVLQELELGDDRGAADSRAPSTGVRRTCRRSIGSLRRPRVPRRAGIQQQPRAAEWIIDLFEAPSADPRR